MKLSYNDATHTYRLDGKRCRSITTVAKIPDDTFGLDQWRKRQVAIGLALKPELLDRVAAHIDDKQQLDKLAEEALQKAGAHDAAARGTAGHRITERIDLGGDVVETEFATLIQAAWSKALAAAQLEIVPELVERVVVYPERRIAGRFDRIARRHDGTLVVVDLKMGANAIKYPHAIACQLALYAHAPLMAGPLPPEGGDTTVFEALPDTLDRQQALIIHMPDDTATVYAVDIAAGWRIVEQACFPILEWRQRNDLLSQLETGPEDLTGWIQDRLAVLKINPQARQATVDNWPEGCPPKPPWTPEQLERINETLWRVERLVKAPFPPDRIISSKRTPTQQVQQVEKPLPSIDGIINGDLVDDATVTALKHRIASLPDDARAAAREWSWKAKLLGRPWTTPGGMTQRAFELSRAGAHCAEHLWDRDDGDILVRAALTFVLGDEIPPEWHTGAVIGSLTIAQAQRLHDVAQAFVDGDATVAANLGVRAAHITNHTGDNTHD